jgi:AcrR family transcriptional regulator
MLRTLTERSNGQEDKRRLILDAAVRVFARKGFHASRVGDIAEEAGVAHGLLYHYFRSKDEVLECIFTETWADIIAAARMVEETDEPARERLAGIAKILLRAWRRDPDLVRVVVREIVRAPELQRRLPLIRESFAAIERIVARGQEDRQFRTEVDARLVSFVFYGALEEILTGWVLGTLEDGDAQIAAAEQTVVEIVCGGLALDRAVTPAPA